MVGRKPGTAKTGGRKKGVKNKVNVSVKERLEKLGCDPIEGMFRIAEKAEEGVTIGVDDNGEPITRPDYALAGQMYKELAQYIAPKRKAIEHTGADGEAIQTETKINVSSPANMPYTELKSE